MLPSVPQVSHHVWLNLETLKFYCLPDNYEIIDPSLEDIKVCLIFSPSSFILLSLLLLSSPSYCPSPPLLPSLFVVLLFFWFSSSHFIFLTMYTSRSIFVSPFFSRQYVVSPTFSQEHVLSLHQSRKLSIALDGTKYLPGIVGLNNIKVRGRPL